IQCGYPGRPAYGRILEPFSAKREYEEGESIHFGCNSGYFMQGSSTRTCLANGRWSNQMPVCDTTLSELGATASHESLSLYPPNLAIDGNVRTCFYSNRHKPRWWRVDLILTYKVLAVTVTVPFASNLIFTELTV
ncbi:sushi: von Willebrand factor type A: EGF and pentraxin domain-containing protein 1-like protein, partial [Dinothrombium tinctorium]